MKCYVHPEAEAVATCTGCGKAVCQTCAIDVGGKIFCQQCLASGVPTQRAAIERTPTNPLAIISLALGILGLIGCCCGGSIGGLIFGLPAAITGWVARRQILEGSQPDQALTLATVGLVLGIGESAASIILLVVGGSFWSLALLTDWFDQYLQ